MLQRRSETEEFVEVGRLGPSDYFGEYHSVSTTDLVPGSTLFPTVYSKERPLADHLHSNMFKLSKHWGEKASCVGSATELEEEVNQYNTYQQNFSVATDRQRNKYDQSQNFSIMMTCCNCQLRGG